MLCYLFTDLERSKFPETKTTKHTDTNTMLLLIINHANKGQINEEINEEINEILFLYRFVSFINFRQCHRVV